MDVMYGSYYFFGSRIKLTWLDLFLMDAAVPRARGIKRFSVGPWSTRMLLMAKLSLSTLKLCFALAVADFKSLRRGSEARFFKKCKTASASTTDFPRIKSATKRTFLGDTLK